MEKYLTINGGSSSLKYSLYSMPDNKEIINGYFEKIGSDDSFYTLKFDDQKEKVVKRIRTHEEAANQLLEDMISLGVIDDISEIKGIGHRILHGGEFYSESVLIDDEVLENIRSLIPLGPLHLPGEIKCIESMMQILPGVDQVAVFDTAFHQTMPKKNFLYAIPTDFYTEDGVRKYGFHGTSHKYITERMKEYYGKDDVNLIICHVGSGASIACIKDGKCFDTTMGLTPLDGLIMGTRSGRIDPSIIEYIMKKRGLSIDEVSKILNKESGLKGLTGHNDFRDVELLANNGNMNAQLAIDMMKDSIVNSIAEYYFKLKGRVDAVVFTAGVGENAIHLRERIVEDISIPMGVSIDTEVNSQIGGANPTKSGIISKEGSRVDVIVMPTNEEYMILRDTYDICNKTERKVIQSVKKIGSISATA